jgi:septation ring formation regulator EzrA
MNERFTYDNKQVAILKNGEFWLDGQIDTACNHSEICNELNALHEENEQLKQRNDRQAKQLDRLYRLIEEKDWRALPDILDDFKRCEEQLQKEWGTYSD